MTFGSLATCSGLPSASLRPRSSTTMRSESRMIARITCSIIRIATPALRMSCTISIIASTSVGLSPASTSSSSSRRGRALKARASSRRFLPAVVSDPASVSMRSAKPTVATTSRAISRALAHRQVLAAEAGAHGAVFQNAQAGQRLHDLVRAGDAVARDDVRRLAGDIGAVELDAAGIGGDDPVDQIEDGRLCRRRSGRSGREALRRRPSRLRSPTASTPPKRLLKSVTSSSAVIPATFG